MNADPIIQVAGVLDRDDARTLIAAGVTHVGFPLRLDVNPEDIPVAVAADIASCLPPTIRPVVITYLSDASDILELCAAVGCSIVQLHGDVKLDTLRQLHTARQQLAIWKSLIVGKHSEADLHRQIHELSPVVDAFITDTYSPRTGASGATGEVHDWGVSRRLVQASPVPVILAGGLTPRNVQRAIAAVRPAGVDSHTGVEGPDGRNDPGRVSAFVRRARKAFATARNADEFVGL